MAFGWRQQKNPTPTHIDKALNFGAKVCMGLIVAVNSAPFLEANEASTISWFLGALAPILMEAKRFWGVETDQKMIPKEDVEVMEEKKETE
jgi:hypothetical protein